MLSGSVVVTAMRIGLAVSVVMIQAANVFAEDRQEREVERAGGEPDAEWVDLKIDLPQPLFVGTPRDLVTPNLESTPLENPPPVQVPVEARNVAQGKLVTSDVPEPGFEQFDLVTDGNMDGGFDQVLELPEGPHFVQVDLESSCKIYAIGIWHYHAEARVYYDVIIQISDDPEFRSGVHTLFNNDHDNSSGMGVGEQREYIETAKGKVIPVEGVSGRFIRSYSNGNTSNDRNHLIELAVFGVCGPPK
jgi:hypothetical protein